MPPIRLALIGAGIFARDTHLPALQSLADQFEVVAIYSRTRASAEQLADHLPTRPDIYTDAAALLARDDLEAADIVLPINAQPPMVKLALVSGKHVISEKPIATSVASGRQLLTLPRAGQVWLVAENWRYEPAFWEAARIVQSGELGKILLAHWTLHVPILPENKYYHTPWRRAGDFPGGFILDTGVHHIAALRIILGEIVEVSAFLTQMRADLPPADTLSASLRFESDLIASYTVTYAVGSKLDQTLQLVGEQGALRVNRSVLEVFASGTAHSTTFQAKSVNAELAAFASAIRGGQPRLNSPQAALQDVAIVEALLTSAQTGRHVKPERIVP